jgi:hypothetical protein
MALASLMAPAGLQQSATEVYEEELGEFEAALDEHVVYYLKNHPEFYDKHNIVRSRPGVYNLDGREISVDWHFPEDSSQQGYLEVVDGTTRHPFAEYVQGRRNTQQQTQRGRKKSVVSPAPAAAPVAAPAAVQETKPAQAGQTHGSPVYCAIHNSSDKRKKTKPRDMPCTSCGVVIQTNYVDFAVCPGCSERENRCMCCGKSADSGKQAPSSKPPSQQGNPLYCANHNSSEKRKKGKAQDRTCTSCSKVIQTNYVDFCLCPGCSEEQERCMCCGNSAEGSGCSPAARAQGLSARMSQGQPRASSKPRNSPTTQASGLLNSGLLNSVLPTFNFFQNTATTTSNQEQPQVYANPMASQLPMPSAHPLAKNRMNSFMSVTTQVPMASPYPAAHPMLSANPLASINVPSQRKF